MGASHFASDSEADREPERELALRRAAGCEAGRAAGAARDRHGLDLEQGVAAAVHAQREPRPQDPAEAGAEAPRRHRFTPALLARDERRSDRGGDERLEAL